MGFACFDFLSNDHFLFLYLYSFVNPVLLPTRASEQGNVIGLLSVCIYRYMCTKKNIVVERTWDLSYLKFVATDFPRK